MGEVWFDEAKRIAEGEGRDLAILASYMDPDPDKFMQWSFEPCAREHEPGRICILENDHAPSSAGSAGDVEALAEVLLASWAAQGTVQPAFDTDREDARMDARMILASDWLAAHTARALAADRERLAEAVVVLASAACVCGGTAACFTCQTADAALAAPHDDRGPAYVAKGTEEG